LTKPIYILGISAFYHDAAAALLRDGEVVAAAQEERFTRIKGDPRFPVHAIRFCLEAVGIDICAVEHVVFYEKPWLHFERILETAMAFAPRGIRSFVPAMRVWMGEKLHLRRVIRKTLGWEGAVIFTEHHESHMGAAFYQSPFDRAAILTVDGTGEWATSTMGAGHGADITALAEMRFPHSLGLLYSAFTTYLGFRVNFDEYKVMGLAPYGEPRFTGRILDTLVDLAPDGSFRLDMDHFAFGHGLTMTNERFHRLLGRPPRGLDAGIERFHMDVAASIQHVTEEILLKMVVHLHSETGLDHLVLGGGVALNCVANGRLIREGPFRDVWIQPAAGDAGSALGCALAAWHRYLEMPRESDGEHDRQKGSLLGPAFSSGEVRDLLDRVGAVYRCPDHKDVADETARMIAEQKVVGLFQGRMEYGPRALGNRSILGDPRSSEMQSILNRKIKFRESFRPFAPAVLESQAGGIFELDRPSPYMLVVADVSPDHRRELTPEEQAKEGFERLGVPRTYIPAVTHVNDSARVQSVDMERNPGFHEVLQAFDTAAGIGCMINTSFNVSDEPIVCTPEDAWRCFMNTDMDCLVMEGFVLDKADQTSSSVENRDNDAEPSSPTKDSELRLFGIALGLASGFWATVGFVASGIGALQVALAVLGLFLLGCAIVFPRALSPVFHIWNKVMKPVNSFLSTVLLSVFFYLAILPIGLVRRLFGSDPLLLRKTPVKGTWWRRPEQDERGKERYQQPF